MKNFARRDKNFACHVEFFGNRVVIVLVGPAP